MNKGTKTIRLTATELGRKYEVTEGAVRAKMKAHGYKADAKKKYSETEFLLAREAGAQMDKAAASAQLASVDGESLQAKLLRRKIKLADIEIETMQAKLDELLNRVVPIEKHKEQIIAVQNLMLVWWDKASENAATKVKDAGVLAELRAAKERALIEIKEVISAT